MKTARLLAAILFMLGSTASAQDNPPRPDDNPPGITQWMQSPSILVYSKTIDWRHNEGIAGADRFFAEFADANGMGIFTTVNGAVFNTEQLARFEVVVFNNVTGETLTDEQEGTLQAWIEDGGAFIALHGSGDASHTRWPWYDEKVIGPEFIGHPQGPQIQEARLVNLAQGHPIMAGIPPEWRHSDEWYSFDSAAKLAGAVPLLGIDEESYIPELRAGGKVTDLRMGGGPENHPLIWARCIAEGRTFYSAIGHSHKSYDDPVYRRLLENAVAWVRKRDDVKLGCPAQFKASQSGWESIFDGETLNGWQAKVAGEKPGDDPLGTFTVRDGVLAVDYSRYENFEDRFGHLFFERELSDYRLRFEYRFVGEQAPRGQDWAIANSGVMLHAQPPGDMQTDQLFPRSIEAQLLGRLDPAAERTSGNVCTPATHVIIDGALVTEHCINGTRQGAPIGEWQSFEADVSGGESIRLYINGELTFELTEPVLDPDDPQTRIKQTESAPLSKGYIAVQSESHPVEFRKIELLDRSR